MPIHAILAALTVVICWGGNYSATKFALADFPPFLMSLLRFIMVCIMLAPFALRQPLPRWRPMIFLSVMQIVVQFGLMMTALHMGLSITSAVIATQLGVPFSCIMAAIFFKDYLGPWRTFGLAVAFMGLVIVAGTPDASEHWLAFLLALVSCLAWSTANLYLKTIEHPHWVSLLFWPGLLSLPQFLVITWLVEEGQLAQITHAATSAWLGVAYSAVLSTLVGYGLWNWLMRSFPVSRVMPFGLLMPVFGISFGALIFDETLTPRVIVGGLITLVGVAIITLRRPKLAELEH
jgi:O-acetylserine/cysteine efflux transporter